ncbi:MAG: preprotein translocase subunit SecA [Alphaproteobacteria bacterium]|nr:MAG: preprotein translocase subunit SecA [Alphaproteobacteria bacterium]
MLNTILKKVFGSSNDRVVKRYRRIVEKINAREAYYEKMSDENLRSQTSILKERLQKGVSLDDIQVDAFAVVREAAKRTLGQRHYDVQLIGGLVLHDGKLCEMKTGEGKTLTSTTAIYLNALTEKGVHVVTVNDYLAKRDATWMGKVYEFLGLTVGFIVHGLSDIERRQAYHCDVTYGTNHEFGFDYLRDNMKFTLQDMVMRKFNFAVVDEVDNILIDEARTPLIISGPAEKSSDNYVIAAEIVKQLSTEHYEKDEKNKNITFSDVGVEKVESLLKKRGMLEGDNLYDLRNLSIVHYLNSALKAQVMFQKNVDYIVRDDEVIIIDEFTGRMMEGRRYSDGLHQSIEAKEGVEIQVENQTLASITYQNYFRLYPKLSGMSGTILTEEEEFEEIYGLRSVSIPTHNPVIRKDYDDQFYVTAREKYDAIVEFLKKRIPTGQPILVGTTSIEKSEYLSALMKQQGIKHSVLNAKYHEQEAKIVAEAGRLGAITISTNMAGRGTDIQLGGSLESRLKEYDEAKHTDALKEKILKEIKEENAKIKALGGLLVIGTERHESRRIDNQLIGRSGRQGDPGESIFFLSTEDDLLRIFGFDQKQDKFRKKMKEGESLQKFWLNSAIARAQRTVEARNFDMRKQILQYDDVMNDQRKIIYEQRLKFMADDNVSETISEIFDLAVEDVFEVHIPEHSFSDTWDIAGLETSIQKVFNQKLDLAGLDQDQFRASEHLFDHIYNTLKGSFNARYNNEEQQDFLRYLEKSTLLKLLDQHWKSQLYQLDHIRQGIGLRGYAGVKPINEYKREAFNAFFGMMKTLRFEIIETLCKMPEEQIPSDLHQEISNFLASSDVTHEDEVDTLKGAPATKKLGRNDPCYCGSGKRYKSCHGKM